MVLDIALGIVAGALLLFLLPILIPLGGILLVGAVVIGGGGYLLTVFEFSDIATLIVALIVVVVIMTIVASVITGLTQHFKLNHSLELTLKTLFVRMKPAFGTNAQIGKIAKLDELSEAQKARERVAFEKAKSDFNQLFSELETTLRGLLQSNYSLTIFSVIPSESQIAKRQDIFEKYAPLDASIDIKASKKFGDHVFDDLIISIKLQVIPRNERASNVHYEIKSSRSYADDSISTSSMAKITRLVNKELIRYLKKNPEIASELVSERMLVTEIHSDSRIEPKFDE